MAHEGVDKGVDRAGNAGSQLSKEQREVLALLTDEFLTVKQVVIARQTTRQAVHKIIKKLRQKGYLTGGLTKGLTKSRPLKAPRVVKAGMIRLHGQHFRLGLIRKSEKFERLRLQANLRWIDGNTVELNNDCIEVYASSDVDAGSDVGFFGEDVTRATALSMQYWTRFFYRLESELGVIIMKPRAGNISLVHQGHYAEVGSALAKDYEEKQVKLRVYAGDDGKLRFLIDNSFNLHELESVRGSSSKPDMERVKTVFNEIADGALLPSEIAGLMREQAVNVREISAALNVLLKLSVPADRILEPEVRLRPEYVG